MLPLDAAKLLADCGDMLKSARPSAEDRAALRDRIRAMLALYGSRPSATADRRAEGFRADLVVLLGKGYSNAQVADYLNDHLRLPPRGRWHATSIRRLRARLGV